MRGSGKGGREKSVERGKCEEGMLDKWEEKGC
jgi:hypothetical protein